MRVLNSDAACKVTAVCLQTMTDMVQYTCVLFAISLVVAVHHQLISNFPQLLMAQWIGFIECSIHGHGFESRWRSTAAWLVGFCSVFVWL